MVKGWKAMRNWVYKMLLTVILVVIAFLAMDMVGVREYLISAELIGEPIILLR